MWRRGGSTNGVEGVAELDLLAIPVRLHSDVWVELRDQVRNELGLSEGGFGCREGGDASEGAGCCAFFQSAVGEGRGCDRTHEGEEGEVLHGRSRGVCSERGYWEGWRKLEIRKRKSAQGRLTFELKYISSLPPLALLVVLKCHATRSSCIYFGLKMRSKDVTKGCLPKPPTDNASSSVAPSILSSV